MKLLFTLLLTHLSLTLLAQQSINKTTVMEYIQNQQYKEAIDYIQPKIAPDNIQDISLYAYLQYLSGNTKEAADKYEEVLKLDSNQITAHQYLATIYQNNPPVAIEHYLHMIRLQPGNANTFRLLASACFRDKQSDTGLYFLNKSYSLNSSDYRTVARLGEELTDRKNYSRADSVLCTFLANDSTHLDVISPAIRLAWQTRDYSRCTELGKILMDHNTVSNSFNYVIAAQYRLKQYRQCINTYDFLAPLNSAGPNILYFAALAHTELKNYDSSNALLQTCIDIATSVSLDDYYTGKSVNYEAMKQYKPAIAALDTAWYLFQRPLRQYSIGRIYDVHLHNKPMAMRHYKRFLLTHPETADEKSIYKYLQSYIGK